MADELDLNLEQPTPSVADKALSDLARGKVMLEARINSLMSSLSKKKQMFDPVMLRAAQGFLSPTKSGSFGESLGNVAGGVAEEQEKKFLQDQQTEKMKLELQSKMYELQKQGAAQDMLGTALGGPKPTMAQAPMAPTAAPVASPMPVGRPQAPMPQQAMPQASNAPTDVQQAVSAIKQNPSIMDELTMTPQIVAAISSLDPALGKIAESVYNGQIKKVEIMQKRYTTNQNGDKIDTFTGETVEYGTRTVDVNSPFDPDATMKMPSRLVTEYQGLDFNKPQDVNSWLRRNGLGAYAIGAEEAGGARSTESTRGGSGQQGMTKAERDLENKTKEKRESVKIDQDNAAVTSMRASAEVAQGMKQDARAIYGYASNPKTSNAFGLLSKAGIGEAILSAAEEGIRVGPYNIGVNNLTTRILQARGTQDEVNAALALGRNISQLELGYTRMFLKGEGAITEGERAIVRRIPPGITDSPKTAMLKSEMIMARSTFDEQKNAMYDKWAESNPTGHYSQFKNSPSYKELSKQYDNKIQQLDKKYL